VLGGLAQQQLVNRLKSYIPSTQPTSTHANNPRNAPNHQPIVTHASQMYWRPDRCDITLNAWGAWVVGQMDAPTGDAVSHR